MGAWGPRLYQDDIAEDVRDYYKDQLHRGKSGTEITQELLKRNEYALNDPDDAPVFWFALADTQWSLGRLEDFVKEKALYHLHAGSDIKRWEDENPKEAKIRAKVLSDLEQKLRSPQPIEKKISQYKLYHCQWSLGDTFAYQLESDLAKEKGLFGRYLLIQKVDEYIWYPGHVVPVVRVKITADASLPHSEEEMNRLDYVQIASRRYDPFDQEFQVAAENLTKEEFWAKMEEKRVSYSYDDFGFLPEYQLKLLSTSSRVIPKKLIMLGNFPGILPPPKEFVPRNKIELRAIAWKNLEKTVLTSYCSFNLRQSPIYARDSSLSRYGTILSKDLFSVSKQ